MELFFWKVADVSEKQSLNMEAPQYFSRRLRDERVVVVVLILLNIIFHVNKV
jgi:hypothetical protein